MLIGLAMGATAGLVTLTTGWLWSRTMDAEADIITRVLSTRTTMAALTTIPIGALAFALMLTVLMLVLRTVTRSDGVAVALVMVLGVVSAVPGRAEGFGLVALFAYFLTTACSRFCAPHWPATAAPAR